MRTCPYCAEEIQPAAIKCRYCGSDLGSVDSGVTQVNDIEWGRVVVLQSDGSATQFLDAICAAAQAVKLPVTERSYDNLMLTIESKGATWRGFSGERTVVVLTPTPEGSKATFTSKTKPSGLARVELKVPARKWVELLIPGFGDVWNGRRLAEGNPW